MISCTVDLQIDDEYSLPVDSGQMLETAVLTTLQHVAQAGDYALTLVLAGNDAVRQLNRDYLGYDKPTDVLSFPAGDPMPGMPDDEPVYLGDLIVAVPVALQQARQNGHSLLDELMLLVVHGVLHLLGHDHADLDEKAAMWGAQTAVLDTLGLAHVTPTES